MTTRNLRRLGVYGENLPTKKSKTVEPSDFLIGGLIGLFERRFKVSFLVNNSEEAREIFGDQETSTYYGWDALKGFFDNIVGTDGKVYIKSHVGYDGTSFDGVVATSTAVDGAAANLMRIDAAYKGDLDYSTSGNNTGYTITNGDRFTTAVKTANTASDTFIIVDSVAGMFVGDIIKVVATGGGGATVYKEITAIDESTGTISFTGAFDGAANGEVDDVVSIPGFQLKIFRKSKTGIETEVETELGKIWCTTQDAVTDFYVENVFSQSKWIKVTDLDPATAVGSTIFPADVSTVTYLTTGSNGTSPTTVAHWSQDLLAFDSDPIRMICNPESTDVDIQKAIETYCRARDDTPKVIFNIAENQSKSQMITIGNNFQRSDDVLGVIVGDWVKVVDPFAASNIAPDRNVPNVGHVMGNWIRAVGTKGIHWVPAVPTNPLFGITDIVRTTAFTDSDRTDIAEAGVNIIQFIKGTGYIIRNFFTPSTTKEFSFANGILMREYIKISVVDSLQNTENEPNNYARIQASRTAILNFLYRLWEVGSTGNVPVGETFGQTIDSETNESSEPSDHFQVQADAINNPQASIESGERNLDTWFTYPSPAGSIKIGVGLLLLG